MTEFSTDSSAGTAQLRAARDFLLANRDDYDVADREFRWPALDEFNWALDWFDPLAAKSRTRTALWIVEEDGSESRCSFAELAARSEPGRQLAARAGRRRAAIG